MKPDVVEADGILSPTASRASGDGQRLHAAEDLGCVVKKDLVYDACLEHRPIHLAPGFDHEREVTLRGEMLDDAGRAGAPVHAVAGDHLYAFGLERVAPGDGRRR